MEEETLRRIIREELSKVVAEIRNDLIEGNQYDVRRRLRRLREIDIDRLSVTLDTYAQVHNLSMMFKSWSSTGCKYDPDCVEQFRSKLAKVIDPNSP